MISQEARIARFHARDYLGKAPFALHVARYDVAEVAPHDHDFLEIALVESGSGTHGSPLGNFPTRAGDVFILRPGAWHSYSESRDLRVYNCVFSLETLQRGFAAALHDATLHHLFFGGPLAPHRRGLLTLHLEKEARQRCVNYLNNMANNGENADALSGEKAGYFLLFLGELAREYSQQNNENYEHEKAFAPHPAAIKAQQLLENECARNWTLGELAAELHIDRFHLTRLFKAHIGLPPMAYLARFRAERAAQLLLRSDAPIAQIGAQVGWYEANLFSRRFSAHFGLSAREYRRKLSGASTNTNEI